MAKCYVLDTSAVLAFTDREDGADEVEKLLEDGKSSNCQLEICAISLMEMYYITQRESGEDKTARLIALVKSWPVVWVYPDEKILLRAGKLKAVFRLSVADAIIAAVAIMHGAILVHKDPEFESITGDIQLLSLPFKQQKANH